MARRKLLAPAGGRVGGKTKFGPNNRKEYSKEGYDKNWSKGPRSSLIKFKRNNPPAKSFGESYDDFIRHAKRKFPKTTTKEGTRTVTTEEMPAKEDFDRPEATKPGISRTERYSVSGTSVNDVVGKKIKRIKVETGRPSSRTLERIAKNNGTRRVVIYDTRINQPDNEILNHSTGFNCKNFWAMPSRSWISYNDVVVQAGLGTTGDIEAIDEIQKVYASVMWVQSDIQIHNQSAFLPMNIKIHMFEPRPYRDNQAPVARLRFSQWYSNPSTAASSQDENLKVTQKYQYNSLNVSLADELENFDVFTSTKLNPFVDSQGFKQSFSYAGVKTCLVPAGQTVHFTHRHHCGPGLNVRELLLNNFNRSSGRPVGYMFMIEVVGNQVEAVRRNDELSTPTTASTSTYMGTCPCWYSVNFKTTMKYVRSETATTSLTLAGSKSDMHYRAWMKDDRETALTTPFFALPQRVVSDFSSAGTGDVFVPVITDNVIQGHIPRHRDSDSDSLT
jgi:hypothetical protein